MDLAKIIAPRKIEDITRIYYGLDNSCRCGCGGTYHETGERGFKMKLNKIAKCEPIEKGTRTYNRREGSFLSPGIERFRNYVNIPVDAEHDKCFCVYFD